MFCVHSKRVCVSDVIYSNTCCLAPRDNTEQQKNTNSKNNLNQKHTYSKKTCLLYQVWKIRKNLYRILSFSLNTKKTWTTITQYIQKNHFSPLCTPSWIFKRIDTLEKLKKKPKNPSIWLMILRHTRATVKTRAKIIYTTISARFFPHFFSSTHPSYLWPSG